MKGPYNLLHLGDDSLDILSVNRYLKHRETFTTGTRARASDHAGAILHRSMARKFEPWFHA